MKYLTLLTALSIAGIAAWYSIVGLMAIFAGAIIPIAIMGGVLEVGKLVTAAWLHLNWKKVPWLMKTYLTSSVVVLMLITSLGIFGFLSKAHLEHSIAIGGTNDLFISNLERQIGNQQRIIDDSEKVLGQLDQTVQVLLDADRIRGKSGALATRKGQKEERDLLNADINEAYVLIEQFQTELAPLKQEGLAIEVEVGPLKYIAELIYGDDANDNLDKAVRAVILLLVLVFDPLAVVLLLAATLNFKQQRHSEIFYEDGNLKVDPDNVVDIDDNLEVATDWPDRDQPDVVEDDGSEWIDDPLPEDEEFEVATGINLEEEIDIIPNETQGEREERLEKYLYGEDVRGVPKIAKRRLDN